MRSYCVIFAALMMIFPLAGTATETPESKSGYVAPPSQSPVERSPLNQALHQARIAGDMDLYYALEAQISTPKRIGESSNETAVFQLRGTTIGVGEYQKNSTPQKSLGFDKDVDVRPVAGAHSEFNQDMVSDSLGNLYVAMEDDSLAPNNFVQMYKSSDDGQTWTAFYFVQNGSASVGNPSLAVGQGSTGDVLLVAYVVDDLTNPRQPEVATMALVGGTGFTVHPVSSFASWDYSDPVIWTDSHSYSGWWAYLTAEAVFDAGANNINVSFWRSTDGVTWDTQEVPFGNLDAFEWKDPEGSFGTDGNTVFLASYNNTDNNIYVNLSDDFGTSFNGEIAVGLIDPEPSHAVDPEIEAAINGNNVMLVYTIGSATSDNPGQTYSTDAGLTWPNPMWPMDGYDPDVNEFAVALTANEGGGSWHVAWTRADWWVDASSRPQDLSGFWPNSHMRVNDTDWASVSNTKKGIASNWSTDRPGVAWSDYRGDGYDTYFAGTAGSIFADGFESGNTTAWN
jgi:hypothetical protein